MKRTVVLILFFVCGCFLFGAPAQAQDTQGFAASLEYTAGQTGLLTGGDDDINALVGQAIKFALSFIGVLFLLLAVFGGMVWLMATDDAAAVKRAKGILINAALGLIIVLISYLLIYEVLYTIKEGVAG